MILPCAKDATLLDCLRHLLHSLYTRLLSAGSQLQSGSVSQFLLCGLGNVLTLRTAGPVKRILWAWGHSAWGHSAWGHSAWGHSAWGHSAWGSRSRNWHSYIYLLNEVVSWYKRMINGGNSGNIGQLDMLQKQCCFKTTIISTQRCLHGATNHLPFISCTLGEQWSAHT